MRRNAIGNFHMLDKYSPGDKPRLGVSACLLGERVRYDGEHKRDAYIADSLAVAFDWVAVCPEVAIGMGVPRPPIQLEGDAQHPRAIGVEDPGLDVSAALTAYGRRMSLELEDIDGYVFKARSPSCGTARVKLYNQGKVRPQGVGLYAREIMARWPLLPVAEEEHLHDPLQGENFFERVFAYRRWRRMLGSGFTVAKLMDFHSAHKLCLMAHGAVHYRALGQIAAQGSTVKPKQLCEDYGTAFMAALQYPATPKRHANVLQHLMGYLKKQIDQGDKEELLEAINAYRLGQISRLVPLTLLRHHFRRFPHPYVATQLYLYPESAEARLREC